MMQYVKLNLRKHSPLVICEEGEVHACQVLQVQDNPRAKHHLSLVERRAQEDYQPPRHKITIAQKYGDGTRVSGSCSRMESTSSASS